jgi:hypothetical protein
MAIQAWKRSMIWNTRSILANQRTTGKESKHCNGIRNKETFKMNQDLTEQRHVE